MSLDFSARTDELEIMDDLSLGGDTIRETLDQLAVVNQFLGGGQALVGVKRIIKDIPALKSFTLADLGCGGGESLIQMARWARANEIEVQFTGFDANPHVVAYAREKAQAYPEISFEVADVTSAEFFQRRFDFMACSLFLHHFSTTQLTEIIPAYFGMVSKGLLISDLQRHWLPWALFRGVSKLLGASHMIRTDGLISIRRAFKRKELVELMDPLGHPHQIHWRWAFRYLVIVSKGEVA